jgi:phospholipase/carboxylesterase
VDELDDIMALLPPLLQSLEALGFIARYLDPARYGSLMAAAGTPDEALRAARPRLAGWPDRLVGVRAVLETAADETLAGFDELRAAPDQPDGLRAIFRALRHGPRAQEALYPLAGDLPPVSRFFLDPGARGDEALAKRLASADVRDDAGVSHHGGDPGARGGYSLYVPEDYSPDRAWPLVVALHGGSGNGRGFLWSWLRDARAHGAILAAPTAIGDTWALSGRDLDTPNLARIVEEISAGWTIDPARRLLTGMSDGGTFCYVSGLEPDSPFTHLAPACASFHPMLAQMADPDRIAGLPIHLTHGALDWMFEVGVARHAARALTAAGADLTYLELDDLSHTYPREVNPAVLAWMNAAPG